MMKVYFDKLTLEQKEYYIKYIPDDFKLSFTSLNKLFDLPKSIRENIPNLHFYLAELSEPDKDFYLIVLLKSRHLAIVLENLIKNQLVLTNEIWSDIEELQCMRLEFLLIHMLGDKIDLEQVRKLNSKVREYEKVRDVMVVHNTNNMKELNKMIMEYDQKIRPKLEDECTRAILNYFKLDKTIRDDLPIDKYFYLNPIDRPYYVWLYKFDQIEQMLEPILSKKLAISIKCAGIIYEDYMLPEHEVMEIRKSYFDPEPNSTRSVKLINPPMHNSLSECDILYNIFNKCYEIYCNILKNPPKHLTTAERLIIIMENYLPFNLLAEDYKCFKLIRRKLNRPNKTNKNINNEINKIISDMENIVINRRNNIYKNNDPTDKNINKYFFETLKKVYNAIMDSRLNLFFYTIDCFQIFY